MEALSDSSYIVKNYDTQKCFALAAKLFRGNDGYVHSIPYEELSEFSYDEIQVVLLTYGLYTFPTTELVDWLRTQVDDDPGYYPDAIEIGCGTGWIGRELEIPATDSKLQERPEIKRIYEAASQPTIIYPDFVEELTAVDAIYQYQPEYVIGSYITNKYGMAGSKEGNMWGVDTNWVIHHCHKFFMIGNKKTHGKNPSMRLKHEELSFPWLVTRGDSSLARIFVWENKQWK